jgi:hypothetical protein
VSLGVYVLDALEPDDRHAVDEHLSDCVQCLTELSELEELPALLATIDCDQIEDLLDPDPTEPSPALAQGLVKDIAAYRARSRTRTLFAAAAAFVLLLAGPVVTALVVRDSGAASTDSQAFAQSISTTDPNTGTNATVALASREWGTRVRMQVGHVPGGNVCELLAIRRDGDSEVVASWRVRPAGYMGTETLTVDGSVATNLGDIDRFEVVTTGGRRLVEVAA